MKLPTRQEILDMTLPVEVHRVSVSPLGVRTPCVYRYADYTVRDTHLVEEARVLWDRAGSR